MDNNNLEKWVNIDAISKHLGVGKTTIRTLMRKKLIPYYKVGGLCRFKISEVDEYIFKNNSKI